MDEIFSSLKSDFFPGETVIVRSEDQRIRAFVREKAKFNAITLPDGQVKPAYSLFRVQTVDYPQSEMAVDDSQLTRDRKTFTKALLRAFLRQTLIRGPWPEAPWMVKSQYAQQYRIDQNVPPHLLKNFPSDIKEQYYQNDSESGPKANQSSNDPAHSASGATSSAANPDASGNAGSGAAATTNGKRGPKSALDTQIRAKILEDLVLPYDHQSAERKMPIKLGDLFPSVEERRAHTGLLLETWVFLNIYGEPLLLDSFTFDDFVDAIRLTDEDVDCPLLDEIHCSLLSAIVGPKKQEILVTLPPEPDDGASSDEESDDEANGEQERDESEDVKKENVKEEEEDANNVKKEEEDEEEGEEEEDAEGEEEQEDDTKKEEDQPEDDEESDDDDGPKTSHAAEFVKYQNVDWTERLRKRMFKDGGWQQILIGVLDMVSYVEEWSETCQQALESLASLERNVTLSSARTGYYEMPFTLRLRVLDILCKLIHSSSLVRTYIDRCIEDSTRVRKEKTERQREIRSLQDTIRACEEEKKTYFPNGYPIPDGDENKTESSPEKSKVSSSEASRKLKIEAEKELASTNPGFQKIYNTWKESTEKFDEEVAAIKLLDLELQRLDCQRLRMLGKDRYHNRYWWFELNGMRVGEDKENEDNDDDQDSGDEGVSTGYAMGRLWIQGPSDEDARVYLQFDPTMDQDKIIVKTSEGDWASGETGNILVTSSGEVKADPKPYERKKLEEKQGFLAGMDDWGYYDQEDEIENLLEWLGRGGKRELKLSKEIKAIKERLFFSIKSRREDLEADQAHCEAEIEEQIKEEFSDDEEENGDGDIKMSETPSANGKANGTNEDVEEDEDSDEVSAMPRRRRGRPRKDSSQQPPAKKRKSSLSPQQKAARKEARREELRKEMESRVPDRVVSWVNSLAISQLGHSLYDTQKKRGPKRGQQKK